MPPPTLSDVARSYRLFLGRQVESGLVASQHVATTDSLWSLVERVWASPEARRRRIGEAAEAIAGMDDRAAASPACTPGQLAQMLETVEADWARRGFGACHDRLLRDEPRYDPKSLKWDLARRLAAGAEEAAGLRQRIAETGAALDPAASVAVFGEHAFRLAGAITAGRYLAVEPGPDAAAVARRAIEAHGLAAAEATTIGAFRQGARGCDLFYSTMALQYAPPPVAYALLGRALEQVAPGGLACFQLACQLHDYRFDAEAYLAGDGRAPDGELHALPQHHVLALLERHEFAPIEVRPDGRLGELGVSYVFLARRRS